MATDPLESLADGLQKLFAPHPKVVESGGPAPSVIIPPSERRVLGFPNRHIGALTPEVPPRSTQGMLTDSLRQIDSEGEMDPYNRVNVERLASREAVQRTIERMPEVRMRPAPKVEDARLNRAYSPELRSNDNTNRVCGPWSLFDGTVAAPTAGNSTILVPIALATNAVSPVFLLNRYPGALYIVLHVHSIAFQPIGTTMTGLQELWFADIGGAVVPLGICNPAAAIGHEFNGVDKRCTTPITDPGVSTLGFLVINNIGIGGTPVTNRYQLGIGYVAMYPDPRYADLMVVPPTPVDVTTALRRQEALETIGARVRG